MISLQEARALIREHTKPLEARSCALADADGRLLRQEIRAPEDFPAFDRSSMDGYAVAADDDSDRFRVVGELQAGSSWPAGALCRAVVSACGFSRGAAIPPGATQVIMQEDVRREGELMIPTRRDARSNIRRRGEEARQGDLLLSSGTYLGPGELALLAQAGITKVQASPRPRALHITTGGELVAPEISPGPGQIRDSNSTLVAALLRRTGVELVSQKRCGDDPAALREIVESVSPESWDVLLLSGGASVGDYDFGAKVLRDLGFEIQFSSVSLKPGKPLIFATRERQIAFVIPGNPVSHFVTFHVTIHAAIECLVGMEPSWPLVEAELQLALPALKDSREIFQPARVTLDGSVKARPLQQQSSGDLCALVGVNGLIHLVPPCDARERGSAVPCLLLGMP